MSIYNFKVSKTPIEAYEYLKEGMDYEFVHKRIHNITDDMTFIIVVYEKYFMRNSSRASLIITINNFYGITEIESVSAGSSQGMIFNYDFGASDEFAFSVKELFKDFIISE